MKNKTIKYLLSFLFVIILAGCGKDAVSPVYPIDEKVNENRPFKRIVVYRMASTQIFTKYSDNPWERIYDAYAEDGFLIIVSGNGSERTNHFFNLLSAQKLEMRRGEINITY